MSIYPKAEPSSQSGYIPTLCLNMIVKNEETIIGRLLASVAPWIDSYCICDTGSTDNTISMIETFFAEKNIPGKIVHEPFRDFGYNRSVSLKACENMENADFILLLDADMVFHVNPLFDKPHFHKYLSTGDTFYIFQGSDQFYYKNTRITKNNCGSKYWGVTHEYLQLPSGTNIQILPKESVFIYDIGDGGCKTDKFERDIRLLTTGLDAHPDNDRYTFYLANSYRHAGQRDNAIESYKKRVRLGGWVDEIWNSYNSIGHCYMERGDVASAIYYWMEAYNAYPERIENLYEIVKHYRLEGKHRLAYSYYMLAKNELMKKHNLDYLFMQKDIYDYKLDYEMTIFGFYCNLHHYDLQLLAVNVLNYLQLPEGIRNNVWSNYKFYPLIFSNLHSGRFNDFGQIVRSSGMAEMEYFTDFVQSTPSIVQIGAGRYLICKRFVNYSIDENGNYKQKSTIETKNVLAIVRVQFDGSCYIESTTFVKHDTTMDAYYVGVEDMRLFEHSFDPTTETIRYSGNRGMPDGTMTVEIGRLNVLTGETTELQFPKIPTQGRIEKNWVWLPTSNVESKTMIYSWFPLVIGNIDSDAVFRETHRLPTSAVLHGARGSTNGIIVGSDIWFIVHHVSYEDRRYYYHMLVALDKTTYQLKKYTKPFTFENGNVEYTLGLTYDANTDDFLIGYSVMDCKTGFISLPRSKVDLQGAYVTAVDLRQSNTCG
jgi:glycosyltransferase involved in cell wall biosynthesis